MVGVRWSRRGTFGNRRRSDVTGLSRFAAGSPVAKVHWDDELLPERLRVVDSWGPIDWALILLACIIHDRGRRLSGAFVRSGRT